ncbi:MAG: hypothetical protein ACREQV_23440 [Candidatus Binatia bacterium]
MPSNQEPSLLQNLADFGTFLAALATLALVYFALRNLRELGKQVNVGQDAATAARESAKAADDAVRESARMRADEQAPRVLALMEAPQWPPLVDRSRRGMPGGGEPMLLETLDQSEVAGSEPYIFDEQSSWFMWFRTKGVLLNEGRGTARVRLNGDARFFAGRSELVGDREIPEPPRVGAPNRKEYLLRPGDVALFEWAYGHPLSEWADAHKHPLPPNPMGACFFSITVFDWLSSGTVDHIFVVLEARPIEPIPNRQGQWRLTSAMDDNVGLTVYPSVRMYQSEGTVPPQPPWLETYAEWNKQHE